MICISIQCIYLGWRFESEIWSVEPARRRNNLLCIMMNDFEKHWRSWQFIVLRMTPACHRHALITGHTSVDFNGTRRGMSYYHIQSVMSCYICHGMSQQWRCCACDGVYNGISLLTSACQKTSTSRMAYLQIIVGYVEDVQGGELDRRLRVFI